MKMGIMKMKKMKMTMIKMKSTKKLKIIAITPDNLEDLLITLAEKFKGELYRRKYGKIY